MKPKSELMGPSLADIQFLSSADFGRVETQTKIALPPGYWFPSQRRLKPENPIRTDPRASSTHSQVLLV